MTGKDLTLNTMKITKKPSTAGKNIIGKLFFLAIYMRLCNIMMQSIIILTFGMVLLMELPFSCASTHLATHKGDKTTTRKKLNIGITATTGRGSSHYGETIFLALIAAFLFI